MSQREKILEAGNTTDLAKTLTGTGPSARTVISRKLITTTTEWTYR